MNTTEIILNSLEFKSIVESLNRFSVEIDRTIRNVQFLSPEQKVLKSKRGNGKGVGGWLRDIAAKLIFSHLGYE